MTDIEVRSDCNQVLIDCPNCKHRTCLPVPFPVALLPCPSCDYTVLVEAVVITTRTLSHPRIQRGVQEWLTYHKTFNRNHALWSRMLKAIVPYPEP